MQAERQLHALDPHPQQKIETKNKDKKEKNLCKNQIDEEERGEQKDEVRKINFMLRSFRKCTSISNGAFAGDEQQTKMGDGGEV